jgi:hypothetical protein
MEYIDLIQLKLNISDLEFTRHDSGTRHYQIFHLLSKFLKNFQLIISKTHNDLLMSLRGTFLKRNYFWNFV